MSGIHVRQVMGLHTSAASQMGARDPKSMKLVHPRA